jgi:hypothetical protein
MARRAGCGMPAFGDQPSRARGILRRPERAVDGRLEPMKPREQLEARERDLARQRRNQEDFLAFCMAVPMVDLRARDALLSGERRKLRGIEEQLASVQRKLSRLPGALPFPAPTLS